MTDEDSGEGDGDSPPDPFDALDANEYHDRQGNPFENLGHERGERDADGDGDTDRGSFGPGPSREDQEERTDRTDRTNRTNRAERDGDLFTPLRDEGSGNQEVDDTPSSEERDHDATGGTDSGSGASGVRSDAGIPSGDSFEDVDRGGQNPFESGTSAFEEVDVEDVDPDDIWNSLVGGGESEGTGGGPEEVDVSKHAYCEGCEHFSPPPQIHCTHEGTEILEFVDVETVRVTNCPIVAERRELDRE